MIRAFQWDLARQVERLDWLLQQLPRYASWGYQELYLHLEDAVEYPRIPGIARPHAYSRRDLMRLVAAADRSGIKVVPIVNLLGHTQYLIKVAELRDLNELRDESGAPLERGQLCPVHPRTLGLADTLLGDIAEVCTAGRIHVGLDESFHLGRHPLSQADIAAHGIAGHFARYVGRLKLLADKRNLRLGIWGDMLALLPEAIPQLPGNISVYDWYYYPFARRPRIELHNFREYDLVPALKRAEAGYWGCAMNGAFRYEPLPLFGDRISNLASWWRRCARTGAEGFLSCSWEPNRLSMDLTVAIDAAAASFWLDDASEEDTTSLLARGFTRALGAGTDRARALARLALGCDERAFTGYTRWEINDRWDTTSTQEGPARFEKEARFFTRALDPSDLPECFSTSLGLRRYLAERDQFVRSSMGAVHSLRRKLARHGPQSPEVSAAADALQARLPGFAAAIERGLGAARALWALSRDPEVPGPNESIFLADRKRLESLQDWIRQVRSDPTAAMGKSPVCGAWQLQFAVLAIEPAVQKIVVEEEVSPGEWRVVHERFTIEFRAAAARPRTRLRLPWSIPVDDPDRRYRIGVRGVGRVAVTSPELINGVSRRTPLKPWPLRQAVIGRKAPRSGLPTLDWTRSLGSVVVRFPER